MRRPRIPVGFALLVWSVAACSSPGPSGAAEKAAPTPAELPRAYPLPADYSEYASAIVMGADGPVIYLAATVLGDAFDRTEVRRYPLDAEGRPAAAKGTRVAELEGGVQDLDVARIGALHLVLVCMQSGAADSDGPLTMRTHGLWRSAAGGPAAEPFELPPVVDGYCAGQVAPRSDEAAVITTAVVEGEAPTFRFFSDVRPGRPPVGGEPEPVRGVGGPLVGNRLGYVWASPHRRDGQSLRADYAGQTSIAAGGVAQREVTDIILAGQTVTLLSFPLLPTHPWHVGSFRGGVPQFDSAPGLGRPLPAGTMVPGCRTGRPVIRLGHLGRDDEVVVGPGPDTVIPWHSLTTTEHASAQSSVTLDSGVLMLDGLSVKRLSCTPDGRLMTSSERRFLP